MSSIRQARTYRGPEEHRLSRRTRKVLTLIVLFLLFHHAVSFFLIAGVRVQSDGMSPELSPGDRLFVSHSAYGVPLPFTDARIGTPEPERGDVVLFDPPYAREAPVLVRLADQLIRLVTLQRFGLKPGNAAPWEGSEVAGRVMAVPGDTVESTEHRITVTTASGREIPDIDARDGSVLVIRSGRPERFPRDAPLSGTMDPVRLGEDEYWIAGDSRGAALSSLHFGPVSRSSIRSRVVFRFFPLPWFGVVR